jgi:hypothetical protein
MNQAPRLEKIKDKGVIAPTLVLPPQGGGDRRINPLPPRGKRV